MQRRLFIWFGASIVLSGAAAALIVTLLSPAGGPPWREQLQRAQRFLAGQFADSWHDPAALSATGAAAHRELGLDLLIVDTEGTVRETFGAGCLDPHFVEPIVTPEGIVGELRGCLGHRHAGGSHPVLLALIVAGLVLWGAAGGIARRMLKPLSGLVQVARDIGDGRLESRVSLPRHATREMQTLADAINDMATRIDQQLSDQRELLAAVSHEIRTPLGHMRVLLDLAEDETSRAQALADMEQEIREADGLVDQLLASSRLDFGSLDLRDLSGDEVAARALERADLDPGKLVARGDLALRGDPTLLGRALSNLLDNASQHGGGVAALVVSRGDEGILFAVEDDGPGFSDGEQGLVFQSFYRGERRAGAGSLGLGLSLVQRIAERHGGRAWAENRPEGGARVMMSVQVSPDPEDRPIT